MKRHRLGPKASNTDARQLLSNKLNSGGTLAAVSLTPCWKGTVATPRSLFSQRHLIYNPVSALF
jgi:hypothetical protein